MTKDIDTLIRDLQDPNRFIRAEALNALNRLHPAPVEALLPLLASAHPRKLRLLIAAFLARMSDSRVVTPLLQLFHEQWSVQDRWDIAAWIGELDHPDAQAVVVTYYAEQMRHGSDERRRDIVYRLAPLRGADVEELLKRAVQDPDKDVRRVAAQAIDDRQLGITPQKRSWSDIRLPTFSLPGDPRMVDPLLEELRTSIREHTIEKLGKSGDPRAVDALLDALGRTGPSATDHVSFAIRLKIVNALGELGHPRALPFLKTVVQTDTKEIDAWGMGVAFSIAEVAQEVIEMIEWRIRKQR